MAGVLALANASGVVAPMAGAVDAVSAASAIGELVVSNGTGVPDHLVASAAAILSTGSDSGMDPTSLLVAAASLAASDPRHSAGCGPNQLPTVGTCSWLPPAAPETSAPLNATAHAPLNATNTMKQAPQQQTASGPSPRRVPTTQPACAAAAGKFAGNADTCTTTPVP